MDIDEDDEAVTPDDAVVPPSDTDDDGRRLSEGHAERSRSQ